ncbi:MAG: hypothetical protein HYU66_04825 [Armatimonadetes bacterium]|nr:hypothetical protein [Armatimonadota bacterium]
MPFGPAAARLLAMLALMAVVPQKPAAAARAVLVESTALVAVWQLPAGTDWRPPLRLVTLDDRVELLLVRREGREAVTEVVRWDAAVVRTIGCVLELAVLTAAPTARPPTPEAPPDRARDVRAPEPAVSTEDPLYRLPVPPARPWEVLGQETVVSTDDPVYRLLASSAVRGWIPDASYRQFVGDPLEALTRRQLVDYVALVAQGLSEPDPDLRYDTLCGEDASRLLWVLRTFEPELAARGFAVQRIADRLRECGATGTTWLATGLAQGRLLTSGRAWGGRLAGAFLLRHHDRLRLGILASSRTGEPFPPGRDRDSLPALFAETDLSRHATLRFGRLATRFDSGAYSLLWSDQARPLDGLYFTWRTKVLGRPFRYEQTTGYLRDGGRDKYIALQSYEYLPTSRLTIGAHAALMTNNFAQALSTVFVPIMLAPPHPAVGVGSRGNLLGSLHASYRLSREVAVYGQFVVDDFATKQQPNHSRPQHIGWLAGVHFTPRWALPGTSYRLEGAVLRDPTTYMTFTNVGLNWARNGVVLGHPYGGGSHGVRLTAHQRLSPQLALSGRFEALRQFRKAPVTVSVRYLELSVRYDLRAAWGLEAGLRSRHVQNAGQVAGARLHDDDFFLGASVGY